MVLHDSALPDPLAFALDNLRLARRARRWDPALFEELLPGAVPEGPLLARTLFPDHCRAPFSPMHHQFLHTATGPVLRCHPNPSVPLRRIALAAPRGHAKSTLASLILPLLAVGFDRQHYIVLLSATVRQAAARLRNIRRELEQNERLLQAFPHLRNRGKPWSARALQIHKSLLESHGSLSEIRGLNHSGHRPSLIILDDTDANQRVRSAAQRESLLNWFDEVIEPLGDRHTVILAVGTILHHDCLLAQLLRRPTWHGTRWSALPSYPTQGQLWSEWMGLLTTPGDPHATENARAYYTARRRAMLDGARALWPQREPVDELYRIMAVQGMAAFRKEKQNDPLPPGNGPWSPTRWSRFLLRQDQLLLLSGNQEAAGSAPSPNRDRPQPATHPPESVALADLATYGYLDPATGRAAAQGRRGGDYAALVTIGREPGPDPRYFLLEVWMAREPVDQQCAQVARAALRWGWNAFAYEANGFQSVLGPQLADALARSAREAGLPRLIPIPITHSQPKDLRIERAGILVQNNRLWFQIHLDPEFLRHATDYPLPGAHDDGLDALAGAVELARSRNPQANTAEPVRTIRRRTPFD